MLQKKNYFQWTFSHSLSWEQKREVFFRNCGLTVLKSLLNFDSTSWVLCFNRKIKMRMVFCVRKDLCQKKSYKVERAAHKLWWREDFFCFKKKKRSQTKIIIISFFLNHFRCEKSFLFHFNIKEIFHHSFFRAFLDMFF